MKRHARGDGWGLPTAAVVTAMRSTRGIAHIAHIAHIACAASIAALTPLAPAPAAAQAAVPARWPTGLSVVAQDAGGRWGLYHASAAGEVQRVATQLEPRQACIAPSANKVIYAAADASLRVTSLDGSTAESTLVVSDAQRTYTQPCMSADGHDLYAVEMLEGKSIETEIVRFGAPGTAAAAPATGAARPAAADAARPAATSTTRIARQPGAQLDPYLAASRWLVYASVACSEGCDRLLEEIWLRDLLTGQARQLTLLNAVSQAPVTDGQRVVFSSNAAGAYKLWQVGVDGGGLRRLTDGPDNDLHPALCGGALVFIRSSPGGASLMSLGPDGSAAALPSPVPGLSNFRALRCSS